MKVVEQSDVFHCSRIFYQREGQTKMSAAHPQVPVND